jgi:hypothetical protein
MCDDTKIKKIENTKKDGDSGRFAGAGRLFRKNDYQKMFEKSKKKRHKIQQSFWWIRKNV